MTVHHGTRETPARVATLGGRFHQLRCEQPLVAARGDRLVVRSIAPPDTLGGGVVLDPGVRRHGPSRDLLARLERLSRGGDVRRSPRSTLGSRTRPRDGLASPRAAAAARRERRSRRLGPQPAQAPRARAGAGPAPLDAPALALEAALRDAGLDAPAVADVDAGAFAALRARGRARRVGRLAFHADVVADVERRVRELVAAEGAVTLARLRDELGTSRKYAQALLEHLDAERVTRRLPDDSRVLRRRG